MTPAISTWSELGRRSGNVLLIVNSEHAAEHEVEASFDQLAARGETLHVIAPWAWRRWLTGRGVPDAHAIYARDGDGAEVDLNYFLETRQALQWIEPKRFALVAGSAPHSVYNEEVKEIFEQRVALFLGHSLFVAHALPQPYVYVFDQPAMFVRQARYAKVARYRTLCRAVVDDCYAVWRKQGSPPVPNGSNGSAVSDAPGCTDLSAVLEAHLGAAFLAFDEASAIALPHQHAVHLAADTAARFADVATHLGDVIRERDTLLARYGNTPGRRLRRWLRRLVRE